MASKQVLHLEFSKAGVSLEDDVLQLAYEICQRQEVTEIHFLESWLSYSISFLNSAPPTLEALRQLETSYFPVVSVKNTKSPATPCRMKKVVQTPEVVPKDEPNTSGIQISDSDMFQSPKAEVGKSGEIILRCGVFGSTRNENQRNINDEFTVTFIGYPDRPLKEVKLMNSYLIELSELLLDEHENRAKDILLRNNLQNEVLVDKIMAGRIMTGDKLTHLLPIEGILYCSGQDIIVDISEMKDYSFFPGQVMLYETEKEGKRIKMKKVYEMPVTPPPLVHPFTSCLKILVAVGPFSHTDNISKDSLSMLADRVKQIKVDVLILIGPLIDFTSQVDKYTKGELFRRSVLRKFVLELGQNKPKVFYVSNSKETTVPLYPTLPQDLIVHDSDVDFLPDPISISINGIVVAVTSTDILMHLVRKDISCGPNRLMKLARHILQQQNMYPLYPADSEVGIDLLLWKQLCRLEVVPHILILPSKMQTFVKIIDGCVVVNPDKITKGNSRGTFCLFHIQPPDAADCESWSPVTHIGTEIIRL